MLVRDTHVLDPEVRDTHFRDPRVRDPKFTGLSLRRLHVRARHYLDHDRASEQSQSRRFNFYDIAIGNMKMALPVAIIELVGLKLNVYSAFQCPKLLSANLSTDEAVIFSMASEESASRSGWESVVEIE